MPERAHDVQRRPTTSIDLLADKGFAMDQWTQLDIEHPVWNNLDGAFMRSFLEALTREDQLYSIHFDQFSWFRPMTSQILTWVAFATFWIFLADYSPFVKPAYRIMPPAWEDAPDVSGIHAGNLLAMLPWLLVAAPFSSANLITTSRISTAKQGHPLYQSRRYPLFAARLFDGLIPILTYHVFSQKGVMMLELWLFFIRHLARFARLLTLYGRQGVI